MNDFLSQHASEIGSFIAGLLGGGVAGSLVTLRFSKSQRVSHGGSIADQNRARAGGDIVGRDKR